MPLVKIRYIGTTDGGLVNNVVYPVVGWNTDKPIILDSNDAINPTGISITDGAKWALVSVSYQGEVSLYP
jgi:hypothetical protein